MQICKKWLYCLFLGSLITSLFAQSVTVPNISAPTVTAPTIPSVPRIQGNHSQSPTTVNSPHSIGSKEDVSADRTSSSDVTISALETFSSLFGGDTDFLGSDVTSLYSLLGKEIEQGEESVLDNVLLNEILSKLNALEKTIEKQVLYQQRVNSVLYFSLGDKKTNTTIDLLDKCQNIGIINKNSDGSFLLSGVIVHKEENPSFNETFYIAFRPINSHKYEVDFTIHTKNEKSILGEMSRYSPYGATKTGKYITFNIVGSDYYIDLVLFLENEE